MSKAPQASVTLLASTATPPHLELVVFGKVAQAQAAGFRGPTLIHRDYPWMRAIALNTASPGFYRGLMASRITITDQAQRYAYDHREAMGRLQELHHYRMHVLRLPPFVWLEL